MKQMTLVFLRDRQRILLGMKKRGFGQGRWNGYGGKLQPGESHEAAAVREVHEECGVTVSKLELWGHLEFRYENDAKVLALRIYEAVEYAGEPKETEEMRPQWFHLEAIPFEEMWPDDPLWLPFFLNRQRFQGRVTFGDEDRILKAEIEPVEVLFVEGDLAQNTSAPSFSPEL